MVWHWWRGCPQPLGPPGLMCAPSVERGGGENGWADGLTGGAVRAGPEPPTKTSGEICCLEQCRPDAESSGPFSSGVGQRCRGGPQSNGKHALHHQGLPPGVDCGGGRGYRRCWADLMAGLANARTMGLTSRRGQGGRCGGSGVRSRSGCGGGKRGTGLPALRPGSKHPSGGPESRFYRLFFPTVGGNGWAENGSQAFDSGVCGPGRLIVPGGGGFEPFGEDLVFRDGLAQVQQTQLRLAEPDNVFGDRPEAWPWPWVRRSRLASPAMAPRLDDRFRPESRLLPRLRG